LNEQSAVVNISVFAGAVKVGAIKSWITTVTVASSQLVGFKFSHIR
jgi:hypothetical protein